MCYSQAEKAHNIRLVEESELPVKQTLLAACRRRKHN